MTLHQKLRNIGLGITTPLLIIPEIFIIFAVLFVYFLPLFDPDHVTVVTTGASIWWGMVFFISLFLGRMYCSHICPMTGFFSFISAITKNREILSSDYPKIVGYIFTTIWLTAPGYVVLRLLGNIYGFLPASPLYSELSVIVFYSLYMGSAIFSHTIARSAVEHYICPFSPYAVAGIKLSKLLHLPAVRFKVIKENCVNCKVCISKRYCLMNMDIRQNIKNDTMDFMECLNCGACAEVCKHKTVCYTASFIKG